MLLKRKSVDIFFLVFFFHNLPGNIQIPKLINIWRDVSAASCPCICLGNLAGIWGLSFFQAPCISPFSRIARILPYLIDQGPQTSQKKRKEIKRLKSSQITSQLLQYHLVRFIVLQAHTHTQKPQLHFSLSHPQSKTNRQTDSQKETFKFLFLNGTWWVPYRY